MWYCQGVKMADAEYRVQSNNHGPTEQVNGAVCDKCSSPTIE